MSPITTQARILIGLCLAFTIAGMVLRLAQPDVLVLGNFSFLVAMVFAVMATFTVMATARRMGAERTKG